MACVTCPKGPVLKRLGSQLPQVTKASVARLSFLSVVAVGQDHRPRRERIDISIRTPLPRPPLPPIVGIAPMALIASDRALLPPWILQPGSASFRSPGPAPQVHGGWHTNHSWGREVGGVRVGGGSIGQGPGTQIEGNYPKP